jgi:hypothetical protein
MQKCASGLTRYAKGERQNYYQESAKKSEEIKDLLIRLRVLSRDFADQAPYIQTH